MKVRLVCPLAALALSGVLPLLTTVPAQDYTRATNNGAITITRYTGSASAVEIPATINGLPVTKIGPSAFAGCLSLTNVTILTGVTSIEDDAFEDCRNLTGITIPQSVESIRTACFADCWKLASVALPDRLTTICNATFFRCVSLTNVSIPSGVTVIGDEAFLWCGSVTALLLPDGLAYIGNRAFGRKQRQINAVSFHCLRHTFVSLLKIAGGSQAVAKELAGHSSDQVSDLYTHVPTEALAKALRKLPKLAS